MLASASCNPDRTDFYQCAKNAGLFSRENVFPIQFDTNITFSGIKILSNEIRDTLQEYRPFGFIYNYTDSSFSPNVNPNYNLVIEGILIIPKNHHVNFSGAHLIIYVTQDSIEIFNEFKNTHMLFHREDKRIRESIADYYNTAYCKIENKWKPKYTHVVIADSLNLSVHFLPLFRMMMSSYKHSIEKYAEMNNSNICDSSKFSTANYRTRGAIEFMVLVDDVDYEKRKQNKPVPSPVILNH